MSKMLEITASHPDLSVDFVMQIDHGDGFADNAKRAGWQAIIPPTQAEIEAAQLAVLQAEAGSPERLEAQTALQELQSSQKPNPVSPLVFLIELVGDRIRELLVDPTEVSRLQQAAMEKIESQIAEKVESRIIVKHVSKG